MLRALVLTLLLAFGHAYAQPNVIENPDLQAARHHFALGQEHYRGGEFDEACREFEIARHILDLPALSYNLAVCEERREHWQRSIDHYQHFVDASPEGEERQSVEARIVALRARLLGIMHAEAPFVARNRRLLSASLAMGGVTLALTGAGIGGYYSAWGDYTHARDATCADGCSNAQVESLRTHVAHAQDVGIGVWCAAGAAAITSAVLAIVYSQRAHSFEHAMQGVTW